MIARIALAVLASVLFVATASAKGITPSPLLIDGKPVDPACLMSLANEGSHLSDSVDLRNCRPTDIVIKPIPPETGMIGFRYTDTSGPESGSPYFFYRYIGEYRGHALLFVESNTGGSGQFTNLLGVDHQGHMLKLAEEIAGGDRCNGGVSNPALANGTLTFDRNVTPHDLINLAKPSVKLEAYKDLEASAASCVAVGHNDANGWTSVTLSVPDWGDQSGWTEQYRYQSCFNRLYHDYIVRKETELDRAGVAAFAKTFVDSCVKKD